MAADVVIFIFKILLFIGLFLLIGAFIKIILDIIKGRNKQKLFKKRNITGSDIDILETEISRIKGYHKIYKTKDYLVYINEYHVDLILFCDYYGMLSGNENDQYWYFNSDLEKIKIVNPILILDTLKQKLLNKVGIEQIRAYILLGSNTRLNVKRSKNNILRRSNVYFTLAKRNEKKKYTSEEIDIMYEKINV